MRFGWLDRQAAERGASARGSAEPQQQAEQAQEDKKPSKFDWLNRQNELATKVQERDEPVGRRQDRGQDERDR